MAEYIEKVAFNYAIREAVKKYPNSFYNGLEVARQIAHDFPAADVRPVVRAKWEWNDNNGYYYCGNCKAVSPREDQDGEYIDCPNFCHHCGACMEES